MDARFLYISFGGENRQKTQWMPEWIPKWMPVFVGYIPLYAQKRGLKIPFICLKIAVKWRLNTPLCTEKTLYEQSAIRYISVYCAYVLSKKQRKKLFCGIVLCFRRRFLSALCPLSTLSGFYSNRMTPTTSAMACIWLRWSVNGGYFSLSDTQVMCSSSLARCTRLMSAPCSVLRT